MASHLTSKLVPSPFSLLHRSASVLSLSLLSAVTLSVRISCKHTCLNPAPPYVGNPHEQRLHSARKPRQGLGSRFHFLLRYSLPRLSRSFSQRTWKLCSSSRRLVMGSKTSSPWRLATWAFLYSGCVITAHQENANDRWTFWQKAYSREKLLTKPSLRLEEVAGKFLRVYSAYYPDDCSCPHPSQLNCVENTGRSDCGNWHKEFPSIHFWIQFFIRACQTWKLCGEGKLTPTTLPKRKS